MDLMIKRTKDSIILSDLNSQTISTVLNRQHDFANQVLYCCKASTGSTVGRQELKTMTVNATAVNYGQIITI